MKTKKSVWIVVKVWRGLPEQVKGFHSEAAARKREKTWRRGLNPDYDETGVFEIQIA